MVLLKELPGNQVVVATFLCQVEVEAEEEETSPRRAL